MGKDNRDTVLLNRIVDERPSVHLARDGRQRCIGLNNKVLYFLFDALSPSMQTLETGCGLSTLVFGLVGCMHTCIVPNKEHLLKTKKAATNFGISFDSVNFIIDRSENYLPNYTNENKLDIALIDGGHAFPIPFIDWFYINQFLRENGLLLIDDIDLKTINILNSYLSKQPEWELVQVIHKTSIFKKINNLPIEDDWDYWQKQPFNRRGIVEQLRNIKLLLKNKI